MFKKIVSLCAVLALVLSCCAFAATNLSSPDSKLPLATEDGSITLTVPAGATRELFDKLDESLSTETIASILGDEFWVNAVVNGLIPDGFDFNQFVLVEFTGLECTGPVSDTPVVGVIDFTTDYPTDKVYVGAVGVLDAEGVATWTPVAAAANTEGSIEVTFTPEVLTQVSTGTNGAALAILQA